jgi:hypothetical protein
MKKVLSVVAIVMLASCGSTTTTPNVSNDTTYRVDSTRGIPVVDAEKPIDTAKEIK